MDQRTDDFGKQLSAHVAGCAALQKKVLVIGCLTLGWIVAHSPEASKLAIAVVKAVAP